MRWLTVNEVAKRLGLSEYTIRRKARQGEFGRIMKTTPGPSGHIRISAKGLEKHEMQGVCNAGY